WSGAPRLVYPAIKPGVSPTPVKDGGQRRRQQVQLVMLHSQEVVGHTHILAASPDTFGNLERVSPPDHRRSLGSCNRLTGLQIVSR
ncbi:hypothetical protein, partial [Pseudonocardia sp. 73-21]|uniref:hypothetical protein n=1 Tax=Pseudonocardia sp. 73-21 TaxID=1895809 RepID=UPI00261E46EA